MQNIILFGGGRESLLNLHFTPGRLLKDTVLVVINYGQKSYPKELEATIYYSTLYKVKYEVMQISIKVPKGIKNGSNTDTHTTMRNVLFVSHVINYYYKGDKMQVLLGTTNNRPYNDGHTPFLREFSKLINKLYPKVILNSYTAQLSINNTYKILLKEKVDISHIWFCDKNGETMCGKCFKCVNLKKYL